MRHLKCLTCRTRLYSTEGDPIGDLCPVCGSQLAALRASGDDLNGHRLLAMYGHRFSATAATVLPTGGGDQFPR
jgi:hypothetical protein